MDYLDSFGDWMRQRREALRLTRPELAECAGCSVSALRKIETDERRPSRQLAELLAGCLHINPEEQPLFLDAARGVRRVARLGVAAQQLDSPPTQPSWNLPSPATSLVGREAELATLAQLLANPGCRLLSLVGPGGIGKTRLAIEAACNAWEQFADGVFFASLAATGSHEFLIPAIAQAVGVKFAGPAEPRAQLMHYLRNKQALVLLDNLEHLLEGVAILAELLAGAPGLKLLVTTRERLELRGEWVFEVQGLPVPAEGETEGLEEHSAVQLFLQRARRLRVDFELSLEDCAEVAHICRLVEGMPLAIELAAAWVPVLTCREIASEIERGLDILESMLRDVPERQRSLRAVFDHSWRLLTEEEQEALSELSLFRGGFQREAAQEVAGAGLSVLLALVSKSLVRRTANGRYDLHELIRQYAMEHLQENAPLWAATKERHAAFYLALADEAEGRLRGVEQRQWLERLELEHDNLRAVLKGSLADEGKGEDSSLGLALQLAASLCWFWYMRGHFHEGRDWLMRLLQRCPEQRTAVCARAFQGAGLLTNALGEHDAAVALAEESIAIYREVGNRQGLAGALTIKGAAVRWQGNATQGNAWLREALALHREAEDRWGIALNLFELGRYLADFEGDVNGQAMLEESAAILDALGDKYTFSALLISLGVVAIGRADYASAGSYLERALALTREIGDPWHAADAHANLGYVLRLQGDYAAARAHSEEALRAYQEGGSRVWEIDPICALAENEIEQGKLDSARRRLAEVRARPEISRNRWLQVLAGYLQGILSYYEGDTERAGTLLEETVRRAREGRYKPDLARSLVALGRAKCRRGAEREAMVLLHEGVRLFQELGHKLGIVTALEGLAELGTENASWAASLLATAATTRETIGAPLPPVEQPAREGLLTAIRTRLPEEAFAQAWAEGRAMSPEQAAAFALATA